MTLSFHKYGNQFFPGTGKFGYSAAQSELTVSTRNSIFECIENRESRIENRESRLEARGSRLEYRVSSIEDRELGIETLSWQSLSDGNFHPEISKK